MVLAGGAAAWWKLVPHRLGLAQPRMVLVTGDSAVDGKRVRAGEAIAAGASVRTPPLAVACFSVHASRVCLGADTQVHLAEIGQASARLEADRGTIVLQSAGDDLTLVLPSGTVELQNGTASVEMGQAADVVVRALAGSPNVQPAGKPVTALGSPAAVSMRDGSKRPALPLAEREETRIAQLAGRWQGSAGAIISYVAHTGRVEIDGDDIGYAPASILLDEGDHTLVVRDGSREATRESLTVKAGQTVVRGS